MLIWRPEAYPAGCDVAELWKDLVDSLRVPLKYNIDSFLLSDESDRVHDAVSHFSVYCDEGGARVDGEETCGAEDHDRGVPNPWGAAWKSKFRAPHVDNLPNSLLDFHTGGEPHVGSV